MAKAAITKRQQYWLGHIKAADAGKGTRVEYANTHGLKVKDLYQWKTLLTRRGLLISEAPESKSAFVSIPVTRMKASCRIVLTNGTQVHFEGDLGVATIRDILVSASSLT